MNKIISILAILICLAGHAHAQVTTNDLMGYCKVPGDCADYISGNVVSNTYTGSFNGGGASKMELPNGTDLPDSPAAGDIYLDTNDGACDDANDSGGTVVCMYNGSAWIVLGNTGT